MPRQDTSPPAGLSWDAIIVAGGRARRLGGIDKTALLWQGRSLLDGVVAAASGARRICVVGSDADLPAELLRAVERPRWGGPAAAIVAGLAALADDAAAGTDAAADWVLVLAGDLVHADAAVTLVIDAAAELPTDADGLISVDSGGRRQPLLAVYRRTALRGAAAGGPSENLAVSSLIGALTLVELPVPDDLNDDVDTPADAARLGIVLPDSPLA